MHTLRTARDVVKMFIASYLLGGDEHVPRHEGADAVQHQGEVDQVKPGIGEKKNQYDMSLLVLICDIPYYYPTLKHTLQALSSIA